MKWNNLFQKTTLVLFLLLNHSVSYSQNFKFKHLSSDQGLSQASVQTIIQDKDGFMWFATQDGLNRYDGFHFKVFKNNPLDSKSISSNVIYSLFEDEDGLIYIGTKETGMSVYNKYTETFTNYKSSDRKTDLPSSSVRSICSSTKDELLVGTENGLCIFNKKTKTFQTIIPKNTDKPFYIMKLLKTTTGKLLIAAPRFGIYEYKPITKTLEPFYIPENLNNPKFDFYNVALTSMEQKDNFLFVGSFNGGVYKINVSTGELINHINFIKDGELLNQIKDIKSQPNSNNILFASFGGFIVYNTRFNTYSIIKNNPSENTSLINNMLLSVFVDKTNTIWLGTYFNGIDVSINLNLKFQHYLVDSRPNFNSINCFLETDKNSYYIGNDIGIYEYSFKNKKILHQVEIEKNTKTIVQCLFEDKSHNILIGTAYKGLILYNPITKKITKILDSYFKNSSILKIIADNDGKLWIITNNEGIFSISNSVYNVAKQYNQNEGLCSNKIISAYFDTSKNDLWLGTDGGGICIFNIANLSKKVSTINFSHSDSKNSISSNVINDITKDKKGIYWIATNNGLNSYNAKTKTFHSYTETNGLSNNTIWTINRDNEDNLWLSTTNGLSKFNAYKKNKDGSSFKNYNVIDGLQAREFNQGASLVCKDGSILVGGLAGFNYFDPKNITDNKLIPKPYIFSFSRQGIEIVMDSSMIYKKYIELPANQNFFGFELIAQNYLAPEQTKFMYQLEGKDVAWSSPSSMRFPAYTSLEGGTYIFKVKACNSDGIWNEEPYQIIIKIIPPWYKTTLFYILASILIFSIVFGFITYKTNLVKKENRLLENKVTERTRELAEKNRDITSSIEYAKRIQEAILPPQELIFSRLKNAFIFYKPKDIVSGDFYWFGEKENYKIIATVDCTGHGVPGAFMSMIGHNLLNQIVSEKGTFDPGLILQELHKGIQKALKQGQNQVNTNEGMDVSILAINTETRVCFWAGAFRSLVVISNENQFEKIEGNKYPVGGAQSGANKLFATHSRVLKENDMLYMFTDGYADQFGGEKGKKFMAKRFHDHLISIHHLDIVQQKIALENQFNLWKGNCDQVDDVLVIGIKV